MFYFGRKKYGRRRRDITAASDWPPKLELRSDSKKIDYDALWASSSSSEDSPAQVTHSPDLSPAAYSDKTSFRIGGSVEGEFDLLCRSLGLSGPDDFAIPAAAWEESLGVRSSCDLVFRSRVKSERSAQPPENPPSASARLVGAEAELPRTGVRAGNDEQAKITCSSATSGSGGDWGIKGTRPPVLSTPLSGRLVLAPPPLMKLPILDRTSSTWDLVRSFAPLDVNDGGSRRKSFDSTEEEEEVMAWSENCTGSFSTLNDNDSSRSTTESMLIISPNGRIKRNIESWMRGQLLGSGSFGTVYEGISDDGGFFAVKEVSLLEKGRNAQQCIFQLEQEIALLSQFEHENIVQYYGTDKEELKLFIFLELVSQGSLASLYQKYRLRDTQVSAYTRQILNGLHYLHERNVVHRDIKCANILVHANGSVKLADFGLAKEISSLNDLKSCKGSVYWMAPEVIHPKKTYGRPADIWSLGCTVLEMLTRQIPYPNVEWQHAFFKIGRGDQPPIPDHLSKEAQDFIRQCVQVYPNSRPTAAQLLQHPFVRRPLKI